jgi:hypothetical protein
MPNSPDVLPLNLLQPLDANQQGSEPTPLGGEQRPVLSPDPGVHHPAAGPGADGDERGWRSSRLRIHRNGQIRSIWAVHLPGWQQLGWQLVAPPAAEAAAGDERSGLVLPGSDADLAGEQESVAEAAAGLLSEVSVESLAPAEPWAPAEPDAPTERSDPPDPDPLTTTAPAGVPNFQAMTKAQIIEHCLSRYGVSLDGDRTKADLVATANALADPDDLSLPDDLL